MSTARVVSIRLTDKERKTIEAALPLTVRRGYHRYGCRPDTESRSEFIVKAATQRAEQLLQERNTGLEAGVTAPGKGRTP